MPGLGRKSQRGRENEYRFIHGKHVIYYSVEPDKIIIERIIYGPVLTDVWGNEE